VSFLLQYVNYSSITLKTTAKDDKEEPIELENGELEARINLAVLRVPECGQCAKFTEKSQSRKLCEKRMEARKKLIAAEKKLIYKVYKEDKKNGKKRKSEIPAFHAPKKMKMSTGPKKKVPKMMKKANGQLKPRVTSQGNKRMSIPDDLFPGFCRRIGAKGTGERMKLINQFAEENPTVSVRQVTLRLGEITTKELPGCVEPVEKEKKTGRAFMFYLRPRFYKHLLPEDRPAGWEKYAEEDLRKWQIEQASKPSKKRKKQEERLSISSVASTTTSDKAESVSNASPSVVDDDGDETEDESAEPVAKILKMDED
jgi:hypothetical protein